MYRLKQKEGARKRKQPVSLALPFPPLSALFSLGAWASSAPSWRQP